MNIIRYADDTVMTAKKGFKNLIMQSEERGMLLVLEYTHKENTGSFKGHKCKRQFNYLEHTSRTCWKLQIHRMLNNKGFESGNGYSMSNRKYKDSILQIGDISINSVINF